MAEFAKSYNREGALGFPLVPYAHQEAWRYVFDWAVAGQALQCIPGDVVLEFGSGPSYASEWFNRLGYTTVALDLNPEILGYAQQRMALDQRVDRGRTNFAAGDGQRLPFANGSVDGIVCFNALHHMPDYVQALSEIRRILKPGGRAVFSEPGSLHSASAEARLAIEQFGAVEKNIILEEIYDIARQVGFQSMVLKPYVYPHLVELDYEELDAYRRNRSGSSHTRPSEIATFMEKAHSVFALTVPGEKPHTSARPSLLRASIRLHELPTVVARGHEIRLEGAIENTGDSLWLSEERRYGGHVRFGVKLCLPSGRLVTGDLGRTSLERDVAPGEQIEIRTSLPLPDTLDPGEYMLRFDMVSEQVAWFEQFRSPVLEFQFRLVDSQAIDGIELSYGAPSVPTSMRTRYDGLIEIAGRALAEMGLIGSSDAMLEPVARAIRGLLSED